MRVAVDYRILADPFALMGRGIGRFTQQQLREVLRHDADNEYLLMCPAGSDRSAILREVLTARNVEVAEVDVPGFLAVPEGDMAAHGLLIQGINQWVRRHRVDLVHVTCPFVLDQPDLTGVDACPLVATVYDLIPYLFAEAYLPSPGLREAYERAMEFVCGTSRILAISRTTAADVVGFWQYPQERVDVTPPFAGPSFRPLPVEVSERRLQTLRARIGLPQRFALTVSAAHHAKNLSRLLEAYSVLPPSFRSTLPLVVCCHLEPSQAETIRDLCTHFRIDGDVLLTGYVTDVELAALYNAAELLVHPSLYEGFGLPVLEAMQCGTPVIATRQSSLPEVAGVAAVLVDAEDVEAMAQAVIDVSADQGRQECMRQAGLLRARAFSAERLGNTTRNAYEAAVSNRGSLLAVDRLPSLPAQPASTGTDHTNPVAPMPERKTFSDIRTIDDLSVVNDAQKTVFSAMVEASGGALVEQREAAYLGRWREALVYVEENACVLDIGGGWPIERVWRAIIAEHGVDYHFIDIDEAIVQTAKKWLPQFGLPAGNASVGVNTELPHESGKFDVVFSSHCLEHSPDLTATFQEISRVLKPEGTVFFSVPFGFDDSDEHLLYFDIEDWLEASELAGFEVINYHVGQTYPMAGWDLSVAARSSAERSNWDRFRHLSERQNKKHRSFALASDPIFSYSGSIIEYDQQRVLNGQGASTTVTAPGIESLLLVRHPWSGIIQLSGGGRTKIIDLYARIQFVGAVDVRSFAGPVTVTVLGADRGRAEQAVVHGALLGTN